MFVICQRSHPLNLVGSTKSSSCWLYTGCRYHHSDPCGTPDSTLTGSDRSPSMTTFSLHVHRMLKSRHLKDWRAQSWSMVVQFGTPQVYIRMTLSPPPPPIRHVRKHHSLAFQTPFANTDIYKSSFSPKTVRDWNSLIDSRNSAAEGAEDCCEVHFSCKG